MMILQISANEFTTEQGHKTLKLVHSTLGHWTVTSWSTNKPTAKYFWGCRTYRTLADVEGHYKAFRGITALLEVA